MAETLLRIPVHYDFASTLCYVAHRVMERMADSLAELEIELDWTPLDLSRLVPPFRRGAEVSELRRANAERVAGELGVSVRVPERWADSRLAGAAAILADRAGRGAAWRERVWTALFEETGRQADAASIEAWALELGLDLEPRALRRADLELETRTETAREAMVTGVPTFMLGAWPFGGIQSEDTMRHVLQRFARKARAGELA